MRAAGGAEEDGMGDSTGRQSLRLPLAAAAAGFAWGYLRHREHPRRTWRALVQAAEWFVACGGAAVLVAVLRRLDEDGGEDLTERVMHSKQTVTDRAAR